jgi:lactate dehydrogenase-like 2-hydroxyacid dehydrogenase
MARRYRAVWTSERDAVPDSLKALTNVVLTPHIGGGTIDAHEAMQKPIVMNIMAYLTGPAVENTDARASLLNNVSS